MTCLYITEMLLNNARQSFTVGNTGESLANCNNIKYSPPPIYYGGSNWLLLDPNIAKHKYAAFHPSLIISSSADIC